MPLGVKPALAPFAQSFYDALAPLAWDDANQGYALAHFINALSQTMEDVEALIRDDATVGSPGWSQALDINRAPGYLLPWLAQFVGVKLDLGLTDAQQRQAIRNEAGFARGTVESLVNAAQKYLTGTRTVILRERDTSPYHLTVITYAGDTQVDWYYYSALYAGEATYLNVYNDFATYAIPYNQGAGVSYAIANALAAAKPAGLQLTYTVLAGQDYWELWSDWNSYYAVYSHYSNYQAVMDDIAVPHPFPFEFVYTAYASYLVIWNEEQTYQDIYDNDISY